MKLDVDHGKNAALRLWRIAHSFGWKTGFCLLMYPSWSPPPPAIFHWLHFCRAFCLAAPLTSAGFVRREWETGYDILLVNEKKNRILLQATDLSAGNVLTGKETIIFSSYFYYFAKILIQ